MADCKSQFDAKYSQRMQVVPDEKVASLSQLNRDLLSKQGAATENLAGYCWY